MTTKTFVPSVEDIEKNRKWYVVDAKDKVLGRLATEIATKLRGKDKPTFTPHQDAGDFVIVVNADKVRVTGRKAEQKEYIHHSGFLGGLKRISFKRQLENHPERILESAIKGMIPRNTHRKTIMKRLKLYMGSEHPHTAQQPIEL